jgi:hypothetical protein
VSSSGSVESGRIWHDPSVSGSTWRSSAKIGDPRKPSGLRSLAAIVSLVAVRLWCLCVSTALLVPKVHWTSETENLQQTVTKTSNCECTIRVAVTVHCICASTQLLLVFENWTVFTVYVLVPSCYLRPSCFWDSDTIYNACASTRLLFETRNFSQYPAIVWDSDTIYNVCASIRLIFETRNFCQYPATVWDPNTI